MTIKKKIRLIRTKVNKKGKFNIKVILKKLYKNDCRNLLIEGGDTLTSHLLKYKIYNKFYLYKSPKNLPKETQNYIPSIMAIIFISKDPEKYGFTVNSEKSFTWEIKSINKIEETSE